MPYLVENPSIITHAEGPKPTDKGGKTGRYFFMHLLEMQVLTS